MRYFVEISYKGTNYHGWQIQPGVKSVQETIEKSFSIKLQENISITGAGRTDTGVHAEFFIFHFDTQKKIDEKIIFGLNKLLPKDIAIKKIYPVKDNLHARFDAKSRTYEYRIITEKNPFYFDLAAYINQEFDIDKLNSVSKILFEYDDFTSFSKLHTDTKTNICKIYEAHWRLENNLIIFKITADRFLRNMVRAIVGTLLDFNSGKININDFRKIIESKNRSLAGKSAEAKGLFLTNIKY